MTKKESVSANEVLLNDKTVAKVNYGGVEYHIKRLSVKQIIRITSIFAKQFEVVSEALRKEGSKDDLQDAMTMISALDDASIYELISTIIGIDTKKAEEGFSVADLMELVSSVLLIEDIEKLVFQIARLKKVLAKRMPDKKTLEKAAQTGS